MPVVDRGDVVSGPPAPDLHARWQQRTSWATLAWRAGVDNMGDRRAWRESPYQFSHTYLFPLAPRTWRLSLQLEV